MNKRVISFYPITNQVIFRYFFHNVFIIPSIFKLMNLGEYLYDTTLEFRQRLPPHFHT